MNRDNFNIFYDISTVFSCRYWDVKGSGSSGETQPNFSDFASFAGFYNPIVKQYGQNIYQCGTYVDFDVYALSNKATAEAAKSADGKPVAGLLLLSHSK